MPVGAGETGNQGPGRKDGLRGVSDTGGDHGRSAYLGDRL